MQRHMEALKCAEDEEEEQIAKVHAATNLFKQLACWQDRVCPERAVMAVSCPSGLPQKLENEMLGIEEENRANMEQLKAEVEALQARYGMREEPQQRAMA